MAVLHHTIVGRGEPLLVLHGLFGSGKNWQSLARRFGRDFETVCADLRNHGQSFHADAMNYAVMTADVIDLLDALELQRAHILGHSMGGKVAMMLAATHPGRVERLIVADIAPVAYEHGYDNLIDPILGLALAELESREQADRLLAAAIPEAPLRAFLLQNLVRDAGSWRWRVNWRVIRRDLERLTGFDGLDRGWQVDARTLFIRGGASAYVGDAEIDVIRQHFTDAHIETIAGAGHWLHAEQPGLFVEKVGAFLSGPG